jgi:hypothetical protein
VGLVAPLLPPFGDLAPSGAGPDLRSPIARDRAVAESDHARAQPWDSNWHDPEAVRIYEVKSLAIGLAAGIIFDHRDPCAPCSGPDELLGDANWWMPKWTGTLLRIEQDDAREADEQADEASGARHPTAATCPCR